MKHILEDISRSELERAIDEWILNNSNKFIKGNHCKRWLPILLKEDSK